MLFLNQAAIQSVGRDQASDASGLLNAARNLGGSLSPAGIAVIQDRRLWLHERRIKETLNANGIPVQDYMAAQAQGAGGMPQALRSLGNTIQVQALPIRCVTPSAKRIVYIEKNLLHRGRHGSIADGEVGAYVRQPSGGIHAVCPPGRRISAKVGSFIDFYRRYLDRQYQP